MSASVLGQHDLGGLDDDDDGVARREGELIGGVLGDGRGDVLAVGQGDLHGRHHFAMRHRIDGGVQLVAGAELHDLSHSGGRLKLEHHEALATITSVDLMTTTTMSPGATSRSWAASLVIAAV